MWPDDGDDLARPRPAPTRRSSPTRRSRRWPTCSTSSGRPTDDADGGAAGAPAARLIARMLIRDASYEQAVAGWADAPARRRYDGPGRPGATPGPPAGTAPTGRDPLPDAVHLELVRRINLAAPDAADVRGLADRVLVDRRARVAA